MTRRICCLLMALLLMALVPAQATAALLYSYPTVVVSFNSNQMVVLEHEFRQWVKELTHQYIKSHVGMSAGFMPLAGYGGDWQIYNEAARLKYSFDSQTNLFGDMYDDLPYNTNEEVSDRDYRQETRDVTFYMLSQNVQNKIFEIEEMSKAERASLFPGKAFNATTGDWEINEQAIYAEMLEDAELQNEIDKGMTEAGFLFLNAGLDLILGVTKADGTLYDVNDLLTDALTSYVQLVYDLEYEQTRKVLKNAYRQAMIDELMAAQRNVDMQMYEGLYMLRDQLEQENSKSTDEEIMLQCLDTVLSSVDKAMEQEAVLKRLHTAYGGAESFSASIDAIAQEAVDSLGLTEEELMDEQQFLVAELVLLLKETLKIALGIAEMNGEMSTFDVTLFDAALDSCFDAVILASERESIDKDHDGKFEVTEVLGFFMDNWAPEALEDLLSSLAERSIGNKIDNYEAVMSAADAAESELENALNSVRSRKQKKKEKHKQKKTALKEVRKERKEAKEKWDFLTENQDFIVALVENGIALTKSVLTLVPTRLKLSDAGRDEVPVSMLASAMYRARQTARKTRAMIKENYAEFVDPYRGVLMWDLNPSGITEEKYLENIDTAIDNAPLEKLRDFVNAMYTVVSTDLLGHSYYMSLCAWHEYQESPEDYANNIQAAKDEYWDKFYAARDRGFGFFLLFFSCSPVYLAAYSQAAYIESKDSEYLEYVVENTTRGSWYKLNDSIWVYNRMGDYAQQFQWDERFDPLFH